MATPRILAEPKRTCEECLAIRHKASPPGLRRKLPPRALPPNVGPSPAEVLEQLIGLLDSPRASSYRRDAERALADGGADRIAEAIRLLQREVSRQNESKQTLHSLLPNLYPKPAA